MIAGEIGSGALGYTAIDRLAELRTDEGSAIREVTLLALLARARGDVAYHDLARPLPQDGGIAWLRRTYRLGRGDDRDWEMVG